MIRRNRSSASDFGYSCTFLCSVVCRLSSDTFGDLRGPATHCVRWGTWSSEKRKIWE